MPEPTERAARVFILLSRVAGVALAVEAATVLGFAVASIVFSLRGDVGDASRSVFLEVFGVLVALALGLVARGLWRGARWARSAAFTWQVFQAALGVLAMGTHFWWALALLAPIPVVLAVVVMGSLRDQFDAAPGR